VVGQGARYVTAAFFAADPGGALAFDDGECTCPVDTTAGTSRRS
jgi:hypothetical protein